MENEHIIREWWEKNRESLKDLVDAKEFFYQKESDAVKMWLAKEFDKGKLEKISEIKDPKSYRNDGNSKKNEKNFYDEIGLDEEERKFVDSIYANVQSGPIKLNFDNNKIPLISSLSKYKLEKLGNNATKKRLDFLMTPENKIPIKPENLKKICAELGLEGDVDDNALIKEMDDLNLLGSKCENPLNQTILYMRMLYDAFIGKDEERNDNEFGSNQDNGKKEIMNEYVDLLLNNHNIILHGAPGTGKTYLAKDIAIDLIFENEDDRTLIRKKEERLQTENEKKKYRELINKFDEQFCFVQFHQSYDYTDFVEGLRPKNEADGKIGFVRKDGVFKEFCSKAIGAHFSNFELVYKNFVDELRKNKGMKLQTLKQKKSFSVRVNSNDNLYATPDTKAATDMPITKELLKIYIETGEIKDWKPYVTAIGEYLKENYSLGDLTIDDSQKNNKYVFVIDEINRGEMSKIFGELFYSIDPGYRGIKGKIRTQYQNLIEEKNVFADGFYVPENVYIIGTMNDIDRSVDSMDFAMRRRFAFKEITAESRKGMLDQLGDKQNIAEKVMVALNKEIEKVPGLSSAYHIGPAYFLKLKIYEGDFVKLWNNHIAGVVWEYLRGMPKADDLFKTLEKVYNEAVASTPKKLDTETATPAEAADENAGESGNG